jgi:hypothetical protein
MTVAEISGHYIGRQEGAKNVVEIESHEDGIVTFSARGGGRVYRAREADFLAELKPMSAADVEAFDNGYEKSFVDGDWFEADQESIPAFLNGERWNGWLCPMFEKNAVDAAIADGRIGNVVWVETKETYAYFADIDNQGMPSGFDLAATAAKMTEGYTEVEEDGRLYGIEVYEARHIQVDGQSFKVYPVGTKDWCWIAALEPENEPAGSAAP